jgi:hypothetical protein
MQTAKQGDAANNRPESFATVFGKLLAVGILLAPPAMWLFPELNKCSGTTRRGKQDAPAAPIVRVPISDRLIPESFGRSDE